MNADVFQIISECVRSQTTEEGAGPLHGVCRAAKQGVDSDLARSHLRVVRERCWLVAEKFNSNSLLAMCVCGDKIQAVFSHPGGKVVSLCDYHLTRTPRLVYLLAFNKALITTVAPFASSSTELNADGSCGISELI